MAKWRVSPGSINNTLKGTLEYDNEHSYFHVQQDEKPFLEEAKRDRENSQYRKKDVGYKKFATIPDIVAMQIKDNHGLDLHAPETIGDKDKMAKLMTIIRSDYPYLLSY